MLKAASVERADDAGWGSWELSSLLRLRVFCSRCRNAVDVKLRDSGQAQCGNAGREAGHVFFDA